MNPDVTQTPPSDDSTTAPATEPRPRRAMLGLGVATLGAAVVLPLAAFAAIPGLHSAPATPRLASAVSVAPAPAPAPTAASTQEDRPGFLGVSTTGMGDQLRAAFGAPAGTGVLVSEVNDDSAAFLAGLNAGDVIVSVDGLTIEDSGDLRRAVRNAGAGASVAIGIVRNGQPMTLTAALDEAPTHTARVIWNGQERDWTPEERAEFERRMEEFGERMEQWGEELEERFDGEWAVRLEQDAEKWEAFGERMEAWGEEFGERFGEEWAAEFEQDAEKWEEFGRRMEEWGEEFGRRMEQKFGDVDWDEVDHDVHFDEKAFEDAMRDLETELENLDLSHVGDAVADALGSVNWAELSATLDAALSGALDSLDGLEVNVSEDRE